MIFSSRVRAGAIILAAALFATGGAGWAPAWAAEPRLEVQERVRDLGPVPRGEVREVRFALKNVGDAPLSVLRAKAGCDCTVVSYDDRIEPGQVGHVTARLDTATLRGPVTKGVTVFTDGAGTSAINLILRAEVQGSVEFLPLEHVFMRKRDDEFLGQVLVRADSAETAALDVAVVDASATWIVAEARKVARPLPRENGLPAARPGDWIVDVRFRDGEPVYGKRLENLTIRTGLEGEPRVTIPVETNLRAPIKLSKDRLVLDPDGAGKAVGTLYLFVRKDLDVAELVTESAPASIRVRTQSAGEQMLRVDVEAAERTAGQILFRVGGESVRLPVEWSR